MDVLGIGAGPLFIFLILGLLLFGPNKVVENARTAGKYIRSFRKMTSEFTESLTREADLGDQIKSAGEDLQRPFRDLSNSILTETEAHQSTSEIPAASLSRATANEPVKVNSGEAKP